jgi:hypothetical protein
MPIFASSNPKPLRLDAHVGADAANLGAATSAPRSFSWAAALVTLVGVGVGGMFGLLIAARVSPAHAGLLRAAALAWFFLWGMVRVFTPRP